jgi:hypothetical protein
MPPQKAARKGSITYSIPNYSSFSAKVEHYTAAPCRPPANSRPLTSPVQPGSPGDIPETRNHLPTSRPDIERVPQAKPRNERQSLRRGEYATRSIRLSVVSFIGGSRDRNSRSNPGYCGAPISLPLGPPGSTGSSMISAPICDAPNGDY